MTPGTPTGDIQLESSWVAISVLAALWRRDLVELASQHWLRTEAYTQAAPPLRGAPDYWAWAFSRSPVATAHS